MIDTSFKLYLEITFSDNNDMSITFDNANPPHHQLPQQNQAQKYNKRNEMLYIKI